MEKRKIWKIRVAKPYPEATNHIAVGVVVEENAVYVKLLCKAFHFRKPASSAAVFVSRIKVRIFPWNTVAYATELPETFGWEEAEATVTPHGNIIIGGEDETDRVSVAQAMQWTDQ